jgi:hypothetical protein
VRSRTRYTLLIVVLALAALVAALVLRRKAPPEAARLLPESDAIVFLNLKPLREATHFDRSPVQRSPDFQQFIDATGIVPERDLDQAAFALHRMDDPRGPNGAVAFSEIFEGRFDGARLSHYLSRLAASSGGAVETYAGRTIYTIPMEGRRLRIVQLGYDTVAASNMPTTEQIHGMIDRQRASASPFSGSSLLAARYPDVPLLSSAWAIGQLGLPFAGDSGSGSNQIGLFGFELPFTRDTGFVASLRYTTALHLRVEEIAPSEADAGRSVQQLNTMLQFLRGLEQAQSDVNPALLKFTESIKIEVRKERAILTATVPIDVLKQLTATAAPRP